MKKTAGAAKTSALYQQNGRWYLTCETTDARLRDIPGLQLSDEHHVASGGVDAVAAACLALKLAEMPPQPDWRKAATQQNVLTLRPYQQQGIAVLEQLLRTNGGALLGDEMGLGKTRQALNVADRLAKTGRKMLLCPASVRETWQDELVKLGEAKDVIAILGPKAEYKKDWERATKAEWVIAGYGALLEDAFKAAFAFETPAFLVLDEVHLLRGRDSTRAKVLSELAPLIPYRLGLTGSVLYDRPRDIYKPMSILLGSRLGSKWAFDARYCNARINDHGGLDNKGVSNADELNLRLSYYKVARTKKEVGTQMPKVTRQILHLDPDPKATAAFKQALLQRAKGMTQMALEATLESKMLEAVRLASEAKRFFLVTWMKKHAEKMHQMLNESGTPCVVITGDVGHKARNIAIKHAAAKGMGVIATMDSVGTGVDGIQHVASFGIMHSLSYLPKLMAQTEARIDRIGQTEPVQWVYLVTRESMDMLVVEKVVHKLDNIQAVEGRDSESLRDSLTAYDESASLKSLYEEMD